MGRLVRILMLGVVAVGLMLDELGHREEALLVDQAVRSAVAEKQVTRDLGGPCTTRQVGDYLVAKLESLAKVRRAAP